MGYAAARQARRAEYREIDELNDLIKEFARSKPVMKFLRLLGVDPKSESALQLSAYGLGQIALGWRQLRRRRRPDPTKWTVEHDITLHMEVMWLRHAEGLRERAAIRRLAAVWSFPYTPQAGRRSPKSDSKKQREDALWQRWKSWKRRNKPFEEAKAKLGPWGGLILLMGDMSPIGENKSQKHGFQFPKRVA
jgi:hypothetical protein